MPRVHFVKKARKDNPAVKKGESYYWWQFMRGPKRYSATKPKPSQLTQSEYLGRLYELIERMEALESGYQDMDPDDVLGELEEIASEARELGEEQSDKLYNMPDSLQYGPTGELLQQRADAMETWADELEALAGEVEDRDEEDDEDEGFSLDFPEPDVE